jgi:hypothetical protein
LDSYLNDDKVRFNLFIEAIAIHAEIATSILGANNSRHQLDFIAITQNCPLPTNEQLKSRVEFT